MDNNIIDFNAFKQKKAESERKKKTAPPMFEDFDYDDDEDFDTDSDLLSEGNGQEFVEQMLHNIAEVLVSIQEYDNILDYSDHIADKITELQQNEPVNKDSVAHDEWENEFQYYESRMFFVALLSTMFARADDDDKELQDLLDDGDLTEEDLTVDVGDSFRNSNDILVLFNEHLQSMRDESSADDAIQSLRALTYSLIKQIDIEYDQLKKEQPPLTSTLMYQHWENALMDNRVRRSQARLLKASVLYFHDFFKQLASGEYSDLLHNMFRDQSSSFLGENDSDDLWNGYNDYDDDNTDFDVEDYDEDDFDDDDDDDDDYDDDDFFDGDYDYWKFYYDTDDNDDDDDE